MILPKRAKRHVLLSYAIFLSENGMTNLPCPLEDHDIFLETKLDDSNISLIGCVLEIKAHELVLLLSFVKQILEIGKKIRHLGAVVRVNDFEIGIAMCKHRPVASDRWIHGGTVKKRGEETNEMGRSKKRDEERERKKNGRGCTL